MAAVATLNYASSEAKPPLDMGVRLRLSVMMFLQFAVWGAWFVVLGRYLEVGLKFSGTQIGSVYGTMALGAIFSMMIAGQLADRVMASEYLMAIFHLAGAALLYLLSQTTDYTMFWWVAFAYALVYNPTLAISNSLAFANIPDATRDFPSLRVLGTIGWIVGSSSVDWFMGAGADITNKPLLLAAGFSAALGLFSFLLPHTPPAGKAGSALPFLKAFGLLRNPSFAIFFGLAFAITIALAFYYTFTGNFLGDIGVKNIASTMSIGQWSEIGFMLLLPFGLRYLGMKTVLAIGMGAWVLRYGFFNVAHNGSPYFLVLVGVALHGVCFDFFLAAGFIHTDNKAPASIRGSAQALFSFLTYGVGMWLGNEISGRVVDKYTVNGVKQWDKIWLVPAIGAAVCLVLFIIFWRDTKGKLEEEEPRG
ncbi:MFS transporter [Humisphaera borealis]|uniref:MFS transporter n=1 Tax=Humisphaera borealis TaxID=2807512 RepID=A0A7M2X3G3_9BACT|nr:MFS transporter [Humisphaera borealis]QOV92263.1 MFS transporter [Humisphaera borealis]